MTKLLWLGRVEDPASTSKHLEAAGFEVVWQPELAGALVALEESRAAVVFISLDELGAPELSQHIQDARPDIQLVGVTARPVPPHMTLALQAGVRDIINLRLDDLEHVAERAQAALKRFVGQLEEVEFLRQLHVLNDEFLRQMVSLEKRNIELENESVSELDDDTYRILIVDDEPTICELLEMVLDGKGYVIDSALNGEDALEMFKAQPYQLVVTDKNLPGISGVDLLREIKFYRSRTDVVVITGFASKQSAIDALNQGATAYLEKPFDDLAQVEGTLQVLIDKQRMRMQNSSYLQIIKDRNRSFLDRYAQIRERLKKKLQNGSDE